LRRIHLSALATGDRAVEAEVSTRWLCRVRPRRSREAVADHRLNGAIGWQTPAERWDGTPFTDQGFEHVPALEHLQGWLAELMAA
jgi:hypothetical protein